MNDLVAKMDGYGKGAWIAAMILGFVIFWPLGLALLFFLIWSGRMGCRHGKWGHGKWDRDGHRGHWRGFRSAMRPSGNSAFDEYKADVIRKLEDEQEAFREFLDRLRKSKDKSEFEQFMSERRDGSGGPAPEPA